MNRSACYQCRRGSIFAFHRIIPTVWLLLLLIMPTTAFSSPAGELFTTWEGVEVDKCASAWLIRRFVDTDARFRMVPRGQMIREGLPFDTPQGEFRVSHRQTTFESILKHYRLTEPALLQLALIVRDVEMKQWDKTPLDETRGLEAIIYGISLKEGVGIAALEKSFPVFDYLFEYLKKMER